MITSDSKSSSLKIISIIILIPFVLVSCAGKDDPQLVEKIQSGDENLSCDELNEKLSSINDDIKKQKEEIEQKEDTNTTYLLLMIVMPVFIIAYDFSEDEEEELKSMENRKKYLEEQYLVKCGTES